MAGVEYKGPLSPQGFKYINSAGLGEQLSEQFHYSSAIVIPANARTIVISGQTGYDKNQELPEDPLEEIMNAFQSVEDALAAAGLENGWEHIYSMTTYHAGGMDTPAAKLINKPVEKYLKANRPAWTAIGVHSLFGGARLEINVWAALPPEA